MNLSRRISGILCGMIAFCCLSISARAEFFQAPSPEIVSAWKLSGEDLVVVFGYDGTYYLIENDSTPPGMERGTFEWDNETGAFSVNTIVDTNGDAGLSHPGALTTVTVSGNTLNYTVPGEGTFTFSRVVNTASAIVGSWAIPGEKFSVTFLADNTYYLIQEANDIPFGYTGMEKGTYTWNSSTKAFTAAATRDTNGDVGLNGITSGVTINITGNKLVFDDGVDPTTLLRITTNPTPLRLPDFGTVRFASYLQTSNAAPALSPFNVLDESYPYFAEAFVDPAVGATAPTFKIGAGATIPLDADPNDPASFEIEEGFATLAELNALLPASTAIQFKNATSTANLTTGASLTFPSIPKILVGSGASWSGGVYRFGENETLQWTLPTGFVASQYLTVLNVYDPASGNDVVDAELHGDVTFLDLGGKLEPGKQYEVELEFYRIDTSTTAGNGVFLGKQGYTLSASTTFFKVRSRNVFPEAPFITEQPISQPGISGSPLLLTVGINEGAFPFSTFQWFRNNQAIPGQSANSLFIPSFNPATDSGLYKVEIVNGNDSADSNSVQIGSSGPTPTVEVVFVEKAIFHVQTGPNTVILDPTPVSPTNGGPIGFALNVQGQNMLSLPAPTVTPPPGTPSTIHDPFYNTLFFDDEEDELAWRYGPNANDWGVLTQAANDARFPNGTYTFLINGVSVPLTLTGNRYPNIPQLTLTGGSWINGKYAVDGTSSVSVATNPFTSYGSNVDGLVELYSGDREVINFFNSAPTANSASLSLPANEIPANEITDVSANFAAIVNKSTALPSAYSAAIYSRQVNVEIHTLPKVVSQSNSQVVQPNTSVNLQVTATGSPLEKGGSLAYQWRKNGKILPDESSSTLSLMASTAAIAGTYTCTVSNAVGTANTQPIQLEYADAYRSFVTGFSLNSLTTGAPEEDFDNDGIANILEFILGGNPTTPSPNLLRNTTTTSTPATVGRNLVFSYDRKTEANGIGQVIETSSTLTGTWTHAVHGVAGVVIATSTIDGTTQRVTATIPSTEDMLFVRLKASR